MKRPITAIQIQTVDACNCSCIMCPHKSVEHSGQAIDDQLFLRIVDEVAEQVVDGRVVEAVEVNLFFQNEPLLDGKLFERARAVRQRLPRAHLVCFTNGLLLARRQRELIGSDFDLLWLSLYGHDVHSFNRVTGLRVDAAQVDEIVRSIAEIERAGRLTTVTSPAWRDVKRRKVLFDFSSRAGFYTGKILHSAVTACKEGRDRWLHFRATGEMVLCCMDWEHETRFAHIGERSLGEILSSAEYESLRQRVSGASASPRDFICKRCEWAVPEAGPGAAVGQPMKTLVFTSASRGDERLLSEWLASLRSLGDYQGEVLVLDYGLSEEGRAMSTALGARLERLQAGHGGEAAPVNDRFVDARPIIERHFRRHAIAYFDVTGWFQGTIAPLFDELDRVPGCLYSVRSAARLDPGGYGPPDRTTRASNAAKVTQVISRCKGPIHGGFVAGRYRPFVEKLTRLERAYADGWPADSSGVNPYLVNVLFDFGRDRADGYRWSCSVDEARRREDGSWYHHKHSDMWLRGDRWVVGTTREEQVVGVHLPDRQETERFSSCYPELFRRTIAEASP